MPMNVKVLLRVAGPAATSAGSQNLSLSSDSVTLRDSGHVCHVDAVVPAAQSGDFDDAADARRFFEDEIAPVLSSAPAAAAVIFCAGSANSGARNAHAHLVKQVVDHALRGGGSPVQLRMIDMYGDQMYDSTVEDWKAGDVPSGKMATGGAYEIDAPWHPVSDSGEAADLLEHAMSCRLRRVTMLSGFLSQSRLHNVVQVQVSGGGGGGDNIINVVNLAALPEPAQNPHHMKDQFHITKSLLAVKKILEASQRGDSFLPIRDSRLSMLCFGQRNMLSGGNVVMIGHWSTEEDDDAKIRTARYVADAKA